MKEFYKVKIYINKGLIKKVMIDDVLLPVSTMKMIGKDDRFMEFSFISKYEFIQEEENGKQD